LEEYLKSNAENEVTRSGGKYSEMRDIHLSNQREKRRTLESKYSGSGNHGFY